MDYSPFPPRVHSHSTPALIPPLDNPNHTQQQQHNNHNNRSNHHYNYYSNRYDGHSSNMPHPLAHHASDEAIAAHFLAAGPPPTEPFGGQTWLDFLRETSADDAAGPYPSFLDGGGGGDGGQMLPPARAAEGGRGSSGGGGGGGLLQTEALGIAERKRRLTAPEPPTRRPGYAGSGGGGSSASLLPLSAASGSSAATAIDLTALPAAWPHRGGGRAEQADAGRRESDIVLPAWQPDSEVAQCPVCGNQFSFWYRKHHCRKCGRVVCANCSPHRITIPRQFIVHPPSELTGVGATIIDLTGDPEDQAVMSSFGPYRNPALGGGEEVRVCNPCVPDPNFSPPPQHHSDQIEPTNWPFPNFDYGINPPPPPPAQPQSQPHHTTYDSSSAGVPRPHRRTSHSDISQARPDQPRNRPDPFRDRRVSFHNRSRVSDLWPPPAPPSSSTAATNPPFLPTDPHTPHRDPPPRPHSHYIPQHPRHHHNRHHSHSHSQHSQRHRAPSSASPSRYRSLLDVNAPLPPSPPPPPPASLAPPQPHQQPQPQQPQRQIAEEDECPVCGNELPPRGLDGGEAEREEHVVECIRAHFSGSGSGSRSAAGTGGGGAGGGAGGIGTGGVAARHRSSGSSGGSGSGSGSGGSDGSVGGAAASSRAEGSRPRRVTASNRMLVYQATEKDCVGEEGEAQECVICFEEFEEGDEMGRLLCLCKFHRSCIRRWWETKGPGSCPTHQLHD